MIPKHWLLVLACAAWLLASHAVADSADAAQLDQMFRRTTLQIATPSARLHTIKAWLADDPQRRSRGLMFVKHLGDDEGMLFVYERPQEIGMWMKNTFIPLDMLFVDATGKVIRIVENTEPHSLQAIESQGYALGVIELKGGTAQRLGLTKGARVMHPAFGSQK
jgi:uncharacterized membrane protein (UPF0127 family)